MKAIIIRVFLWSWLLTLPVTILGAYVGYKAVERFQTFQVRYDPAPGVFPFSSYIRSEWDALYQKTSASIKKIFNPNSKLRTVNIFVPEANVAKLNSHLPQSGFNYVKARMVHDGKLIKIKIKYRGDFLNHWGFDKKSIRVKTSKNNLFNGMRTFNLQAPKFTEHLNNYFAYQLGEKLGLITPRSELIRLLVNNKDQGVHILVEQLKEETLRRNELMPADIYRGEIIGKDRFFDSGATNLFETAAVWDKVSSNNHYDAAAKNSLQKLLDLIDDQDNLDTQRELSALLDIDAWARFSVFEALAQTKHFDHMHNWRLYYDPWRQKMVPIIWDPVGWVKGWSPKSGEFAVPEVIVTELHQALFKNGDFIRARFDVLQDFFSSSESDEFIKFVSDSIDGLEHELRIDPQLRPGDPARVYGAIRNMERYIQKTFNELKKHAFDINHKITYSYDENKLQLIVAGHLPVKDVRLVFDGPIKTSPVVTLDYKREIGATQIVDVTNAITVTGSQLNLTLGLLPNVKTTKDASRTFPERIISGPANYIFTFDELDDVKLIDIHIKRTNNWEPVGLTKKATVSADKNLRSPVPMSENWRDSWQLFYDIGEGFNQKHSINQIKINPVVNDRWKINYRLPSGVKSLRVDPKPGTIINIDNIQLKASDSTKAIPSSEISTHQIAIKQGQLVVTGDESDPYFYFDTRALTAPHDGDTINIEISFSSADPVISKEINSNVFDGKIGLLYAPVKQVVKTEPIVWSGAVELNGLTVIDNPLVLEPGTTLIMGEEATLVIKNQLIAKGTPDKPIRVLPSTFNNNPWGAVVLLGQEANNSVFEHCEFAEGSGLKDDLFEYTAMLSIHDVKNVVIRDCLFRDNKVVDDMVHVVYSSVIIERSTFIRANADALDIDISDAAIIDSKFEGSGNDAIDLMTSNAVVTGSSLVNNGDKGISVGEGSHLLAVDNQILANEIGVQAKDGSVALLFNQTISKNKSALSAYKKNWRYGKGGTIVLSKSTLDGNDIQAAVEKYSTATLFDSFIADRKVVKRVNYISIDNNSTNKSVSNDILPIEIKEEFPRAEFISPASQNAIKLIDANRRGAYTNVR